MTQDIQDLNSRIDRIEVTLSHAVDAIEKMANVVNKGRETKWGPIIAAVSLLFVAAGGYTTLITMPMNERANNLENEVNLMQERELKGARALGRLEGLLEAAQNE